MNTDNQTDITDEQKKFAWWLVKKYEYEYQSLVSYRKESLYADALAQVCFADVIGRARPHRLSKYNFVGATIFRNRIQIVNVVTDDYWNPKFSPTIKHSLVENYNNKATIIVFTHINKRTLKFQILGWISKMLINDHQEGIYSSYRKKICRREDGSSFERKIPIYKIREPALQRFMNKEYFLSNLQV